MAEIEITILTRPYKIACADGDEEKVKRFAKNLDEQMTDLQSKLKNVSDINLFVINSLMTLDKLNEAENKSAPVATPTATNEVNDEILAEFEKIATRIETVAKKIKTI